MSRLPGYALIALLVVGCGAPPDYRMLTFQNDLGKGKHGYMTMPAFEGIKELSLPCRHFIPPVDMLADNVPTHLSTLSMIIKAKRNGDVQSEFERSTKTYSDHWKEYADAFDRLNLKWQYFDKIELDASVKVGAFELYFLKCSTSRTEQYETVLLTAVSGETLQAMPDTRDVSTKLNYVHSAFVTGAWIE